MELVKVLELGGLERQVVCCERDTRTHHNQLSLEVLHHVAEEVVGHGMELFVSDLAHFQGIFKLIAQRDH